MIYGGDANGTVIFAADDRTDISTTNDQDFLVGGAGNDTVFGGDDSDLVAGEEGDDLLYGGLDADVVIGGTGHDTVYGGDGADQFVFVPSGHLAIMDFNAGGGPISNGDPTDNDFVDLTAWYTSLAEAKADLADDGILNQSFGNFSDNASMEGGSITLAGVAAQGLTYDTTLLV